MKKITANELRQLLPIINELESDLRHVYKNISGGFVITELYDWTDNFIDLMIRYGCQSDCDDSVTIEFYTVNRKTMKLIEECTATSK